jgi:hypothetical protein
VGTPWVVVPADDAALRGDQIREGLIRFLRIDAIVGAALVLASGQPIEGLWLEVTDGYSAPMAGRDIATLALLGPLANVVISAGEHGPAVCELIAATMTNDEINFANEAGTLVGALTLGIINKVLEPYAGAVLAKVFVLVAIMLFIQRRPRGLFALKGRAAEA